MNINSLKHRVRIKSDGAIFLGKYVVCDGSDFDIPNTVFTQIHSDRMIKFPFALQSSANVIVSEQTAELLIADKDNFGDFLTIKDNFKPIPYDEPFKSEGTSITLLEAQHVLGSAQVLFEDRDHTRILYSSEFRRKKAIPTDILVLDSTRGGHHCSTINHKELGNELVELVRDKIEKGFPVILQARSGLLQEIMERLSGDLPENIPFLAPPTCANYAQIYENHGHKIRKITHNYTDDAADLISSGLPLVQFISQNPLEFLKISVNYDDDIFRIEIGEHISDDEKPKSIKSKNARFNFENHVGINDIIEYVKECEPKLVITDKTRSTYGPDLASAITSRLGIPSIPYPI